MRHIAIIGGGFSGTMTAVNLARLCEVPLRVTVINHGYPQGRGVAYSTRRPEHLLNVAARNLSALPEHPNHFIEWLRMRTEFTDTPEAELRETFMPRRIYGDYVRSPTLHYTQPFDRRGRVETKFVDAEAVDIVATGNGARIALANGVVQPDEMDMGLRIGPDFLATERNGRSSTFLHVIGPLLRDTLWESIAVPELRGSRFAWPRYCSRNPPCVSRRPARLNPSRR